MLQRTNIYLDRQTLRSLKLLAAARGKTMSDLVRDAVEEMLGAHAGGIDWRAEVMGILDRGAARNLPDLSAAEIAAEVKAARSTKSRAARRLP